MIKIKKEYENTAIAFGRSGIVLKERSQQDLVELALLAKDSGDKSLLKLFETLPSIEELKKMKLGAIIAPKATEIKPQVKMFNKEAIKGEATKESKSDQKRPETKKENAEK